MGKKIVKQLADTLVRLVQEGQRYPRLIDLEQRSKVSKSTLGRARSAESALRIDNLEDIAHAYGLDAWQMLVPGVDPSNPPRLITDEQKQSEWPFKEITPAQFALLSDAERAKIEERALTLIEANGIKSADAAAA